MKAPWTVDRAADLLLDAEDTRGERGRLTAEWSALDLDTAYQVQDKLLARKQTRGEQVVGIKLGLTSRAKQQRMSVDSPLTAWLTDAMALPAGDAVPVGALIHPRVEPEIVLVLGESLRGPGVTAAQAMAAVRTVCAGAEIIDSRYSDYSFALPDVVADNASAARFVLGPVHRRPDGLDLTLEAALVEVGGEIVDSATGAAVQGHPGEALALAANSLGRRGITLEAGWIVLTGGMTDAVPIGADGHVSLHFTSLGSIALRGA
ncbi:2-keto-4-pentenoate hydratase [Nocardia sp. Marseille-Q1738]